MFEQQNRLAVEPVPSPDFRRYRRAVHAAVAIALLGFAGCITPPVSSTTRPGDPPISVPPNATESLTLTGGEEVPPVTTTALATASFEVRPDGAISGSVATTGINATAAHIHLGPPGTNGPVIIPLTRTADNVWSVAPNVTLSPDQYASYRAANLYVNVHSAAHSNGEIRAQLRPR
ncbi:MAG: CHRD domain-containing protein [Casimicrobiaceae bacterium]